MSLKVVIVEDNPTTVLSLVKTIDWDVMKCEVAGTAGDGESGGVMIRQLKPDIVLTDIRMPVKSGLDMIADVREDVPDCRFVIITGYDEFQYASQAIKLGVFDYLLKPIDNEEVMRTVRRAAAVTRRQMENDVALEQAENLKMRAQLLTLLTNDSQRDRAFMSCWPGRGCNFTPTTLWRCSRRRSAIFLRLCSTGWRRYWPVAGCGRSRCCYTIWR